MLLRRGAEEASSPTETWEGGRTIRACKLYNDEAAHGDITTATQTLTA